MNKNQGNSKQHSKPLQSQRDGWEQFSLITIFYAVTLFASGMAIAPGTIVFSCLVLLFWYGCFNSIHRASYFGCAVLIAIGFIVLVLLLLPTVQIVREPSRRVACSNNMRQLGLAMLNYESSYQQFPNAQDKKQSQIFSWRVAILPYIEQDKIYRTYDFSEPWDSKSNFALAETNIEGFQCPSNAIEFKTPYKLVTGPGTVFDSSAEPTLFKIKDGTSNTIILIEDVMNQVYWSEPVDISIADAVAMICNMKPNLQIHHHDSNYFVTEIYGINVCYADGSVGRIGFNADAEAVRNAFLCSDGNAPNQKPNLGLPIRIWNWARIIAVITYVALILLPFWSLIKNIRNGSAETDSQQS